MFGGDPRLRQICSLAMELGAILRGDSDSASLFPDGAHALATEMCNWLNVASVPDSRVTSLLLFNIKYYLSEIIASTPPVLKVLDRTSCSMISRKA